MRFTQTLNILRLRSQNVKLEHYRSLDVITMIAKTFLIEDRLNCSAHFIISSLLDFYLKSNDSVIFVGLQQNYGHYYSISKRIGNSLDPHLKSDALTYIDFFSSLTDWVPEDLPLTEETTIFWNPLPPKAIKLKIEKDNSEAVMSELYELIKKNLSLKKGLRRIFVIIIIIFRKLCNCY